MARCDFDCFNCPYDDCVAKATDILNHEKQTREHLSVKEKRPVRYAAFAKRICDCRKQHGFTQRGLATAVGVSSSAVGLWEVGQNIPSTKSWDKLLALMPELAPERPKYDKEMIQWYKRLSKR